MNSAPFSIDFVRFLCILCVWRHTVGWRSGFSRFSFRSALRFWFCYRFTFYFRFLYNLLFRFLAYRHCLPAVSVSFCSGISQVWILCVFMWFLCVRCRSARFTGYACTASMGLPFFIDACHYMFWVVLFVLYAFATTIYNLDFSFWFSHYTCVLPFYTRSLTFLPCSIEHCCTTCDLRFYCRLGFTCLP